MISRSLYTDPLREAYIRNVQQFANTEVSKISKYTSILRIYSNVAYCCILKYIQQSANLLQCCTVLSTQVPSNLQIQKHQISVNIQQCAFNLRIHQPASLSLSPNKWINRYVCMYICINQSISYIYINVAFCCILNYTSICEYWCIKDNLTEQNSMNEGYLLTRSLVHSRLDPLKMYRPISHAQLGDHSSVRHPKSRTDESCRPLQLRQ